MKVRIDLHCHSRFSSDGVSEPEEMVQAAKERGLHGFAITDHNTSACVDYFLSTGLMREDGKPVDGFLILPGQEITTSAGHLLALGVRLPDLKGISPAEAMKLIQSAGGLAVPPHPYDNFRAGIRESILQDLPLEAIEVFNAAVTFKRANQRSFDYAVQPVQIEINYGSNVESQQLRDQKPTNNCNSEWLHEFRTCASP